jgi:hypothetical protein
VKPKGDDSNDAAEDSSSRNVDAQARAGQGSVWSRLTSAIRRQPRERGTIPTAIVGGKVEPAKPAGEGRPIPSMPDDRSAYRETPPLEPPRAGSAVERKPGKVPSGGLTFAKQLAQTQALASSRTSVEARPSSGEPESSGVIVLRGTGAPSPTKANSSERAPSNSATDPAASQRTELTLPDRPPEVTMARERAGATSPVQPVSVAGYAERTTMADKARQGDDRSAKSRVINRHEQQSHAVGGGSPRQHQVPMSEPQLRQRGPATAYDDAMAHRFVRILLTSNVDADRYWALESLASMRDWHRCRAAAEALRHVALNDYVTVMRLRAIEMLAALPTAQVLTADTLRLSARYDSDETIRRTAEFALARLAESAATPAR